MMTSKDMASYIIEKISDLTDPSEAVNAFYSALCEYVEANAEVLYAWAAVSPPPASTPDPMTAITCTIKTTGTLSPSGATDCTSALAKFSSDLNTQAALWTVVWPTGFALTPAFIIPTINVSASNATDMNSAWLSVCANIISGLKTATSAASGTHATYTGAASFTSIL